MHCAHVTQDHLRAKEPKLAWHKSCVPRQNGITTSESVTAYLAVTNVYPPGKKPAWNNYSAHSMPCNTNAFHDKSNDEIKHSVSVTDGFCLETLLSLCMGFFPWKFQVVFPGESQLL